MSVRLLLDASMLLLATGFFALCAVLVRALDRLRPDGGAR